MSIGTMGDRSKCYESLTYLGIDALVYGVGLRQGIRDNSVLFDIAQSTGVIAVGAIMLNAAYRKMVVPTNIISAGRNAWRDCDGSGWLKKHLDSMKAKVNAAIDKAKSLAPQPQSKPVPIASYAVSAEAMAAARPSGLGLFARDAANAAENVLLPAVVIGGLVFGALKAAETGDISTMQRAFAMAVR